MNLLVFLSDACNLSCRYCFLALSPRARALLEESDAARAVEAHARRWGPRARVTLLGGEPLLHPELALSVARRARAAGAAVSAVSNGTRLSPGLAGQLDALGVRLTVSLDGREAAHDRERRLAGGGGSHAAVLRGLRGLDEGTLSVNLVLTPGSAPTLLSEVEWLRGRGLRRLSFHADVRHPWTAAELAALETALGGLVRYARALPAGALELSHLETYRRPLDPAHGWDDLVLGADGRYYACDAYLSRPYGEGLAGAIGDARSGPDWEARERLLGRLRGALHAALGGAPHHTCPRESWVLAELEGRDPAAAARAFAAADALVGAALGRLAAEEAAA